MIGAVTAPLDAGDRRRRLRLAVVVASVSLPQRDRYCSQSAATVSEQPPAG